MGVAKSTGRNDCATRVLGDLKVASTNARATQEGGVKPPLQMGGAVRLGGGPYKCQRGVLGKAGGNEVQPEARLMGICVATEGCDARE
jgi:hypothetical protein